MPQQRHKKLTPLMISNSQNSIPIIMITHQNSNVETMTLNSAQSISVEYIMKITQREFFFFFWGRAGGCGGGGDGGGESERDD